MHSTVNLASTNGDHLQDHPDVLIFDQDDRFVLVRIKNAEALAGKGTYVSSSGSFGFDPA